MIVWVILRSLCLFRGSFLMRSEASELLWAVDDECSNLETVNTNLTLSPLGEIGIDIHVVKAFIR